jgi:hypothetical protein
MQSFVAASLVLAGSLWAADKVPTGPETGTVVPAFSAVDQTGKVRTLADLTGPKGFMLVFFRSADW